MTIEVDPMGPKVQWSILRGVVTVQAGVLRTPGTGDQDLAGLGRRLVNREVA
jgi:hypothetical protein